MVGTLLAAGIGAGAFLVGTAGGFVIGQRTGRDEESTTGLERPAELVDRPARPGAVTQAISSLVEAVDAVVETESLEESGEVSPTDDPVERAQTVRRTVRQRAETPLEPDQPTRPDDLGPSTLTEAVSTVENRTDPSSRTARRLIEYLGADEVAKQKLTDTIETAVVELDRQDALVTALEEVEPHVPSRELARSLTGQGQSIDGKPGDRLETVARNLREAIEDRERCRSEREQLLQQAEQVCSTARDQTTVTFDPEAGPVTWLSSLADRLDEGAVSFTDRERSIRTVAGRLDRTPRSKLGREFFNLLTSEATVTGSRETLESVIDAIDRAETAEHRLEGVEPADVKQLADGLVGAFELSGGPASSVLQERAAELRSTVEQATTEDLVTVYAARQELRFYEHRLLPQLQAEGAQESKSDLAARAAEIEDRRSTMRTDYPSNYPDYDHNIPIHFLELVNSFQKAAEKAENRGNEERARGYLDAADRTLDWVAELYERHAYSVLLEQLRG